MKGRIASITNTGQTEVEGGDHLVQDSGDTVPSDGAAGYATGCLFSHTDGGSGTAAYINEGSATSADFNALPALTSSEKTLLSATAGVSTPSKALILDSGGDLETGPIILSDLAVTAGAGFTAGADSFASYVEKFGSLFKTTIVIDIDGNRSGGTANDIIGDTGASACHIGQITAAKNGTIFAIRMTCLETPATGDDDIDLWSADEASGVEDTLITGLSNQVQLTNGGNLTTGTVVGILGVPVANQYLYLAGATGDANAEYSAGVLVIELWGK